VITRERTSAREESVLGVITRERTSAREESVLGSAGGGGGERPASLGKRATRASWTW